MRLFLYATFVIVCLWISSCTQPADDSVANYSPNKEYITLQSESWDTSKIKTSIDRACAIGHQYPDSAMGIFNDALAQSIASGYPAGIARSCQGIGLIFAIHRRNFDTALVMYRKALPFSKGNDGLQLLIYENIGLLYHTWSKYDSSIYYSYKALKYAKKSDSLYRLRAAGIYHKMAQTWYLSQHFDKAMEYTEKAEATAVQTKRQDELYNILNTRVAVLMELKAYDSALALSQRIVSYRGNNITRLVIAYLNIGSIMLTEHKRDTAGAIAQYRKAYTLIRNSNPVNKDEYVIKSAIKLAHLLFLTGKEKEAEKILEPVMVIAEKSHFRKELESIYQLMALIYDKGDNYKMANRFRTSYIKLVQDIYTRGTDEYISQLDAQYKLSEKDRQIALNNLKLARQRTWIIGISAGTLLLLGLSIGLLKRKKHKEQMAELKATLAGAEQERTRLAKELHDGVLSRLSAVKLNFTTLPGMQESAVEEPQGFKEALQQLELSISELRATSHNLYPEILEREGLVHALQLFCEKISNIAPVKITFQSVGNLPFPLPKKFELSLYRIVQELVQNIVKHSEAQTALVQLIAKDRWLNISVEDNGKGLSKDWKKKGIGLSQLEVQIKAMHGGLHIDGSQGTNIYMEFDLQKVKNGKSFD